MTGQASNYPLSASTTYNTTYFSSPSFSPTPSGATLTGGTDQQVTTIYDNGTVSVTVNGFIKTASYAQGSTSRSIATDLANQFNADWSSPVSAQASASSLLLTSLQPGSGSNYTVTTSSRTNNNNFSGPSFTANSPGTLTGGSNLGTSMVPVYRMAMAYYGNGNVWASDVWDEKDPVFDSWSYAYDEFNRIRIANGPVGQYGYSYDRYGNRWHQAVTGGSGFTYDQSFNAANQSGNASYDAAGNVSSFNDPAVGLLNYTYDAENRLLSISGANSASYAYDAFGRRVMRTTGGTTYNDFYDADGHVTTDYNAIAHAVNRFEMFGGGKHIVTYTGSTDNKTYFAHTDWLGTEHARSDPGGLVCESSTMLPFGDHLQNAGGGTCDLSPNHFTGKQRDAETNLDYFGARYYTSTMGRWITPDWAEKPEAVPYSVLGDPQSLNLYQYVRNNPSGKIDEDGHCCFEFAVDALDYISETRAYETVENWGTQAVAATGALLGTVAAAASNGQGPSSFASPGHAYDSATKAQHYFGQANTNGQQRSSNSAEAQSTPAQPPQHSEPPEERDRYVNPGHHDPASPNYVKGKTPLPGDAESTYAGAVKDANRATGTSTTYYGKTGSGKYYRYQGQNGEVHWNGEIKANKVPAAVRKQLNEQQSK